jgi:bacteriocin biosynthesis cyclodehydratase domain-containing protein
VADLPGGVPAATRERLGPEFGAVHRTAPARSRPGTALAARARARVVIRGGGRICVPLAALLAAAGVGHVHVDVHGTVGAAEVAVGGHRADDLYRPRATAAAEAVRAVAPDTDTRPPPAGTTAHLAVLARSEGPAVVRSLTPEARQIPHLAVGVRGQVAVVGPLVVPGRTACLQCVYLHRVDRDPAWPALAAQLAEAPEHAHCGAAVAAVAAGLAALQVLAQLDGGEPEALSASLEIGSPAGLVRRRTWAPHPLCGCVGTPLADVG